MSESNRMIELISKRAALSSLMQEVEYHVAKSEGLARQVEDLQAEIAELEQGDQE